MSLEQRALDEIHALVSRCPYIATIILLYANIATLLGLGPLTLML